MKYMYTSCTHTYVINILCFSLFFAAQADFKVWSGRENLRVYFMNPDDIEKWRWKCRGEFMDFNVILAWARVWNSVQYQDIPFLERTDHPGEADIRVKFSSKFCIYVP